MARIAGVDIPREKRLVISLTYVFGIGRTTAEKICESTGIDVSTRTQVIDLLGELREEFGLALVMVSHDLGSIAASCARTLVLRDGRVVEAGATAELLSRPSDPYTQRLIASIPRLPR